MAFFDHIARADAAVLAHLGSVPVIYQPEVGDAVTVDGVFDENYTLSESGETGVENIGPAVSLRFADLPVDPELDEPLLTIAGKQYRVRVRQPDSVRKMIMLLLLRADL